MDDVVQETLVSGFLHSKSGYDRSRGPFRRWLYGVVRTKCADYRRRSKLHLPLDIDVPDPSTDEDKRARDREEQLALVKNALGVFLETSKISRRDLEIFTLKMSGMSSKEIAAKCGCSEGHVNTVVRKVYMWLRQLLGTDYETRAE